MTATDRLRELLDARGVHWWAGEDERKTLWESNGLTWEYFNNEDGDAWLGFLGACEQDVTPEQAIAATLGSGRQAELQKALNRAAGNWAKADAELRKALDFMRIWISEDAHLGDSELSAAFEKAEGLRKLDAIESAIATTLGDGKLTAEQVMAIAGKHQPDYCSDTHVCFDWQAIADELNTTLGGGECEIAHRDGDWYCTGCNETVGSDDPWNELFVNGNAIELWGYCPFCGRKVKR